MIGCSNSLSQGAGCSIKCTTPLLRAISGIELSRVRTELRLLPHEPINQSLLVSSGPALLCNQVSVRPGGLAAHRRVWEAPSREYTETLREVAMEKPRHPQVIRPWKTEQHKKTSGARRPRQDRGQRVARSLPYASTIDRTAVLLIAACVSIPARRLRSAPCRSL